MANLKVGDLIYLRPNVSMAYYSAPDNTKRLGFIDAGISPVLIGTYAGSGTGSGLTFMKINSLFGSAVQNIFQGQLGTRVNQIYLTDYDFDFYYFSSGAPSNTGGTQGANQAGVEANEQVVRVEPTEKAKETIIDDVYTNTGFGAGTYNDLMISGATGNPKDYSLVVIIAVILLVIGLTIAIISKNFR